MFKYIIIFYVISTCSSDPRRVGDYQQLVLVEHTPITSFFAPLRNVNTSADEFLDYLRDYWMIFDAQTWIVRGLWPVDSSGARLADCVNTENARPIYDHGTMDEEFTEALRLIWPVLRANGTEELLWTEEYNAHGSCLSAHNLVYFDVAMLLWSIHDLGDILGRSGIVPGRSFELDVILVALGRKLKKRFYVKCLRQQSNEDQYLLEIQLCFDRFYTLVDCYRTGRHDCDGSKRIMYPGVPRNER